MKIGKWILGLLAGIGGLLAIILGMKNGQSKRQFNKAVKDNKKKEKDIIKKDVVPVITPMGLDDEEIPYNINADTAAGAIARSIKSRRLMLLTDVEGLLDSNDK